MNTKNMLMFVVLSAGMLTALTATTMSLAVPVFAGKKHCEDNDDNNCNNKRVTQKIYAKNDCEIENENKDHSKDNVNTNGLECSNLAANVNDLDLDFGFGQMLIEQVP